MNPLLPRAVVALGSNLGDRASNLRRALAELERAGCEIVAASGAYRSRAVLAPGSLCAAPEYLNAAAVVRVAGSPARLLDHLLAIETRLGRTRRERWGPRTLDLDLIFFENETRDDPRLTLPHPRWGERDFVLRPLLDVAGEFPRLARRDLLAALASLAAPARTLRDAGPRPVRAARRPGGYSSPGGGNWMRASFSDGSMSGSNASSTAAMLLTRARIDFTSPTWTPSM